MEKSPDDYAKAPDKIYRLNNKSGNDSLRETLRLIQVLALILMLCFCMDSWDIKEVLEYSINHSYSDNKTIGQKANYAAIASMFFGDYSLYDSISVTEFDLNENEMIKNKDGSTICKIRIVANRLKEDNTVLSSVEGVVWLFIDNNRKGYMRRSEYLPIYHCETIPEKPEDIGESVSDLVEDPNIKIVSIESDESKNHLIVDYEEMETSIHFSSTAIKRRTLYYIGYYDRWEVESPDELISRTYTKCNYEGSYMCRYNGKDICINMNDEMTMTILYGDQRVNIQKYYYPYNDYLDIPKATLDNFLNCKRADVINYDHPKSIFKIITGQEENVKDALSGKTDPMFLVFDYDEVYILIPDKEEGNAFSKMELIRE